MSVDIIDEIYGDKGESLRDEIRSLVGKPDRIEVYVKKRTQGGHSNVRSPC